MLYRVAHKKTADLQASVSMCFELFFKKLPQESILVTRVDRV